MSLNIIQYAFVIKKKKQDKETTFD